MFLTEKEDFPPSEELPNIVNLIFVHSTNRTIPAIHRPMLRVRFFPQNICFWERDTEFLYYTQVKSRRKFGCYSYKANTRREAVVGLARWNDVARGWKETWTGPVGNAFDLLSYCCCCRDAILLVVVVSHTGTSGINSSNTFLV